MGAVISLKLMSTISRAKGTSMNKGNLGWEHGSLNMGSKTFFFGWIKNMDL